jgi:hypothetical protein
VVRIAEEIFHAEYECNFFMAPVLNPVVIGDGCPLAEPLPHGDDRFGIVFRFHIWDLPEARIPRLPFFQNRQRSRAPSFSPRDHRIMLEVPEARSFIGSFMPFLNANAIGDYHAFRLHSPPLPRVVSLFWEEATVPLTEGGVQPLVDSLRTDVREIRVHLFQATADFLGRPMKPQFLNDVLFQCRALSHFHSLVLRMPPTTTGFRFCHTWIICLAGTVPFDLPSDGRVMAAKGYSDLPIGVAHGVKNGKL